MLSSRAWSVTLLLKTNVPFILGEFRWLSYLETAVKQPNLLVCDKHGRKNLSSLWQQILTSHFSSLLLTTQLSHFVFVCPHLAVKVIGLGVSFSLNRKPEEKHNFVEQKSGLSPHFALCCCKSERVTERAKLEPQEFRAAKWTATKNPHRELLRWSLWNSKSKTTQRKRDQTRYACGNGQVHLRLSRGDLYFKKFAES